MRVSVLTAVKGGRTQQLTCLESVASQARVDVEHILVTQSRLRLTPDESGRRVRWIHAAATGVYEALEIALQAATGEVIGVLGADDVYCDDDALSLVVERLRERRADSCFGDLLYCDLLAPNKTVRYWRSGGLRRGAFYRGWSPPHPAFFVRRQVLLDCGGFRVDFETAGDYELAIRLLLCHGISTCYIPRILVRMKTGGRSNPRPGNLLPVALEDYRAWRVNGLRPLPLTILWKKLRKIPQYWYIPPATG